MGSAPLENASHDLKHDADDDIGGELDVPHNQASLGDGLGEVCF